MVTNGWGYVLNYDGVNNVDVWASRRVALKTKMIGDIFKYVYGDSCDSRIRPVIAYQVISWNNNRINYILVYQC